MKLTYHNIFKSALFALAVPLSLASCSFDGDYDDCADQAGDVKTVRLQITANDPDEVANTRFSPEEDEIKGNEAGKDGEYINSLDIFIVSSATSGNVVRAFHLDAEDLDAKAAEGNLKQYTSESIKLTDGTPYTVYAFANMSTNYSSGWAGIETIGEGGTLSASTLNAIMLDDPAGKIDKSSNFIPMSATQTIESLSSPVIEVSLDRLVSKIRLAIKKDENVNVTSLKISGWADKVPLMNNATVSGEAYDCGKTFSGSDLVLTETDGTYSMEDFYVNESPKGHNFNVEVTTDEPGTPTYTATTVRDNIPRNCIYPLTLNLNEYLFDITAECWIAPMGAYVPVTVNFEDNTFHITLPNLCTFQFTGSLIKGTEELNGATYTWSINDENTKNPEAIEFVDAEGEEWTGQVLKGLVAYQDEELPKFALNVSVNATSNPNIKVSRTYSIEITTKQFFEFLDELSSNSNSATRGVGMSLAPEVLNLSIKQQ